MIRNKQAVETYEQQHEEAVAMLNNLKEFLASMPSPNADGHLDNVDYGFLGSFAMLHQSLEGASRIADEMTK